MANAEGRNMEDDFGRMALDAWWHAVHSSRLSHDDALLAALKGFRLYTERMADALAARTREVEEMREDADRWRFIARDRAEAAERERDAARRELAALRDESVTASAERQSRGRLDASAVSDPAPLSCTGNPADSGNQAPATPEGAKGVDISIVETPLEYGTTVRPAPASAPRRWWIGTVENVLDGTVREVLTTPGGLVRLHEHERLSSVVVPVIEARVTRETVEEIATTLTSSLDITPSVRIWCMVAELVAKRLGLTVEDDNG